MSTLCLPQESALRSLEAKCTLPRSYSGISSPTVLSKLPRTPVIVVREYHVARLIDVLDSIPLLELAVMFVVECSRWS